MIYKISSPPHRELLQEGNIIEWVKSIFQRIWEAIKNFFSSIFGKKKDKVEECVKYFETNKNYFYDGYLKVKDKHIKVKNWYKDIHLGFLITINAAVPHLENHIERFKKVASDTNESGIRFVETDDDGKTYPHGYLDVKKMMEDLKKIETGEIVNSPVEVWIRPDSLYENQKKINNTMNIINTLKDKLNKESKSIYNSIDRHIEYKSKSDFVPELDEDNKIKFRQIRHKDSEKTRKWAETAYAFFDLVLKFLDKASTILTKTSLKINQFANAYKRLSTKDKIEDSDLEITLSESMINYDIYGIFKEVSFI